MDELMEVKMNKENNKCWMCKRGVEDLNFGDFDGSDDVEKVDFSDWRKCK